MARDTHGHEELDQEATELELVGEQDTSLLPEGTEGTTPEASLAVEDYGTTGDEQSRDEPLTERLRREVPDITAQHRPVDPDRAANSVPGQLLVEDGEQVGEGDTPGSSPEEVAMHVVAQRARHAASRRSTADRLDLMEAEVAVLLTMGQIHTEALAAISEALERSPVEEPNEAARRISRAAHDAHNLLLALRNVPQ